MTLLSSTLRPSARRRRRARDSNETPRKRSGIRAGSLGAPAAMPREVAPMLATSSDLPCDGGDYSFEYKWDGVRAICFWGGRRLRLSSRNRLDMTVQYPELQALGPALGSRTAVLDGEVVALDDLDRPSFPLLQKRMKVTEPATAQRLSRQVPVTLFIFDVLYLDGRSTTDLPLERRRDLLEDLTYRGPSWQVSPAHVNRGVQMLEAARANQLEGIVAKRLGSVYQPGRRSTDWLKVKTVLGQEFVIGGWLPEKESGEGLGSLQIGYYDALGELRFAGGVGSGFSNDTVRTLLPLLEKHRTDRSPFADPVP